MSEYVGKQSAVTANASQNAIRNSEPMPGKSTLAQDWPAAQIQAPIAVAQEIMRRGAPAEDVARVIAMQPQHASAILLIAQQLRGNAYVQQIVKQLTPTVTKGTIMGGFEQTVGKTTAMDTHTPSGTDVDAATPGKATLAQHFGNGGASTTDQADAWKHLDVSNATAGLKQGGFNLSEHERNILENRATFLIGAANTAFMGAAGQVYANNKIELQAKAAELDPVTAIFLGALGVAGGMVVKAFVPAMAVKAVMSLGISKHPEVPEGALEFLAIPVDLAKDAAKGGLGPTIDDNGTGFLNNLTTRATAHFDHVHDQAMRASDGALAAVLVAFETGKHTVGLYSELIESALKRFLGSKASKIGRELTGRAATERRVAWTEPGHKLAFVTQDFSLIQTSMIDHRRPYNGEGALSIGDDTTPDEWDTHSMQQYTKHADAKTNVAFDGFVPDDLVAPSLAQHEAKWQAEPETYDLVTLVTAGAK